MAAKSQECSEGRSEAIPSSFMPLSFRYSQRAPTPVTETRGMFKWKARTPVSQSGFTKLTSAESDWKDMVVLWWWEKKYMLPPIFSVLCADSEVGRQMIDAHMTSRNRDFSNLDTSTVTARTAAASFRHRVLNSEDSLFIEN